MFTHVFFFESLHILFGNEWNVETRNQREILTTKKETHTQNNHKEHMIYLERKRLYSGIVWSVKYLQCHGILCVTGWHAWWWWFWVFVPFFTLPLPPFFIGGNIPFITKCRFFLVLFISFLCHDACIQHLHICVELGRTRKKKKTEFNCFEWIVPFVGYFRLFRTLKFFFVFLLRVRSTTYFSTLNTSFVNEHRVLT